MAARSVSVFLRANVTGFVSGFRTAQGAARNLNRQVQQTGRNVRSQMQNAGRATSSLGGQFGRAGQAVTRFGGQVQSGMRTASRAVGQLERTMQGSSARQVRAMERVAAADRNRQRQVARSTQESVARQEQALTRTAQAHSAEQRRISRATQESAARQRRAINELAETDETRRAQMRENIRRTGQAERAELARQSRDNDRSRRRQESEIRRTGRVERAELARTGRASSAMRRTQEAELRRSAARQREAFSRLGQTGTITAVGLVAGFVVATRAAMTFDKQMSAVESVADATSGQLLQLRNAALQAGRSTAFSATQAAEAEEELAKAGVSAADVIGGGLTGALNLASAGTLDVGEAAEIAATAMTQFQLSGKDVPHIADLLSAGANKAQGTVHDLGFALKMGGLVGHQFGLTVEETTGTLAAFAHAGLVGRDSGTSFKTMLLHLANPTKKTRDLMHELGINVYDARGQFIGITKLAEVLQTKLGGLTEAQRNAALAQIFGTDAIRGANVLYQLGSKGLQDWIDNVNDSGNAADTAAKKLDNLHGDLMKLKGALTTSLIGTGEGAQGPLRGLIQSVTGLVNAYNGLPGPAKSAIFWVTGITGAALLGARALVFMVTTARDARVALAAFGLTSERVAAGLAAVRTALGATAGFLAGPWGIAIATGISVLAIWSATKKKAAQATSEFVSAIEADSGALGANTRAVVANKLEQEGVLSAAQKLGLNLGQVTDAVLGNGTAYEQLRGQLDSYGKAVLDKGYADRNNIHLTEDQAKAVLELRTKLEQQNGSVRASVQAARRQAAANQGATASQAQATTAATHHAEAQSALSQALTSSAKSADDLEKALDALAKANMDADQAAINQRKAAIEAKKAREDGARVTDKERQALLNLADANHKQLVAMKNDGAAAATLTAKQRELANQFVKIAMVMGKSRAGAIELAKRYGLITKATDLTRVPFNEYIARVNKAGDATRKHAMKTGTAAAAEAKYAGYIRSSLPVLYALAGGNQKAREQVDRLAAAAGLAGTKMDISKAAFYRVADALGVARGKVEALWKEFGKIKSKTVGLTVDAKGLWVTAHDPGRRIPGLAEGGRVPAMWDGANRHHDSQPAMLRVDEHVWTPEEVDAVGGHQAMLRMRSMAKAGKLRGYATGGRVGLTSGGSSESAVKAVYDPIYDGMRDLVSKIGDAMGAEWKKYVASGGPVVAAARAMIGLPYSWGGGGLAGPSLGIGRGAGTLGFDCSGLTQFAWGQGRHIDIGGVTDTQWANSRPIPGPRPGALGFPSGPSVHVMLASKPGYVVQAPYTGSFVQEVPRSAPMWRWPNKAGFAAGGPVRRLGENYTKGAVTPDEVRLARALGLAGDPGSEFARERHTAQIQPAGGPIRVWAEPETGGEAYIPLAASKRARSKQILAKVARKFGMQVKGMADGGILTFADGGVDDFLGLSDILSQWEDIAGPATYDDLQSARGGVKTQKGQLSSAKRALAKAKQSRGDRIRSATRRLQRALASSGKGRAGRIADARDALAKAKRTDTIRNAEAKLKKERQDLAAATKKLTDTEKRYQLGRQRPTTQLSSALSLSIKNKGVFIANLTKLSDRGFGTLARELLNMGGSEAEKIAADAVKLSDKSLGGLQSKIGTAKQQQATLENLPNILTARSALRDRQVRTWQDLLRATGLSADDLSAAMRLMKTDLLKTRYGKTIWAQMVADGYAGGGWITGRAGIDTVPIRATSGEFMVNAGSARARAGLVEAINAGASDAVLRRLIPAPRVPAAAVGGGGAAAPLIGELNVNHVPGYSTPQDVVRALRHVELTTRYHRRRPG